MSERYVPHHSHNPADCEGCVDAERESDRLCAEITALKAKLAAAETGACPACSHKAHSPASCSLCYCPLPSAPSPPDAGTERMSEEEWLDRTGCLRLVSFDLPEEMREKYFKWLFAVENDARRAREEEGRKNRALLEIQSQCAGHADEFSRRVWQIACAALEGRTT